MDLAALRATLADAVESCLGRLYVPEAPDGWAFQVVPYWPDNVAPPAAIVDSPAIDRGPGGLTEATFPVRVVVPRGDLPAAQRLADGAVSALWDHLTPTARPLGLAVTVTEVAAASLTIAGVDLHGYTVPAAVRLTA